MAVRLNNREYKPDAQASGSSAQCRNLSQTKRKNVVQWAVEPLARASGLYWGPSRLGRIAAGSHNHVAQSYSGDGKSGSAVLVFRNVASNR